MIYTKFPYNPTLLDMSYKDEVLTITFKKNNVKRSYYGVSKLVAYGLYYKTTAAEVLSYYSNQIKGKYTVEIKH